METIQNTQNESNSAFTDKVNALLEEANNKVKNSKFNSYSFSAELPEEYTEMDKQIYELFVKLFPVLNTSVKDYKDIRLNKSHAILRIGRCLALNSYYQRRLTSKEFIEVMQNIDIAALLEIKKKSEINKNTKQPIPQKYIDLANKKRLEELQEKQCLIRKFKEILKDYQSVSLDNVPQEKEEEINKTMTLSLEWNSEIKTVFVNKIRYSVDGSVYVTYNSDSVCRLISDRTNLGSALNTELLELIEEDAIAFHKEYQEKMKAAFSVNRQVIENLKKEFNHMLVAQQI